MHTDRIPLHTFLRRCWPSVLLSVAVCGCGGSAEPRHESTAATPTVVPSGEVVGRFDVGGGKLNLRCFGSGSPAVVFETEHGSDTGPYMNLARQVGAETRTCVYDRAGLGLSDKGRGTPDGLDVDEDLTALLAAARVPAPYVFVGHAQGGLLALLHAAEHPGDVRGLVLLDAVHPDVEAAVRGLIPAGDRRRIEADGQRSEPLDLDRASAQLRARLDDLPKVPTTVITATRFDDVPARWQRAKIKRLWLRYQDRLAAMIPGARHVSVDAHTYDMWTIDPFPVLEGINAVVRAAR